MLQDYLLERDVDGVELRGLRARQHPLLAMLFEMNVGLEIGRIAQVIDEPNQRVDQVGTGLALRTVHIGQTEDGADRRFPLAHDGVEVFIDEIADVGSDSKTFGIVAVDGTEEAEQELVDRPQVKADGIEILGAADDRSVGGLTFDRVDAGEQQVRMVSSVHSISVT